MSDLTIIPCEQLKGVGQRVSERLAKLDIKTVADLLWHLPLRYEDQTRLSSIQQLMVGQTAMIEADVVSTNIQFGRKRSFVCQLNDATGSLQLRFFYFNASQQALLSSPNVRVRCFGHVTLTRQGLSMVHPEYQIIQPGEVLPLASHYTPVYPTTDGIKQGLWRKLMAQALHKLDTAVGLQDFIPADLLSDQNLPDLKSALITVHHPPASIDLASLNLHQDAAQKRLIIEELLAQQLSLQQSYQQWTHGKAQAFQPSDDLQEKFLAELPFTLTAAQHRVAKEISEAMCSNRPMLRLVQGDVGSGKTVVAALASLNVLSVKKQVAIMAPTEILAEQHCRNFQRWLEPLGFHVARLTGSMRKAERDICLAKILDGSAHLIVGTHALIQDPVIYHDLALVIVDEQHRFGVHQRLQLRQKNSQVTPHQLIMTATPIPRTLAMSLFADMACSIIDERPPGRKPIQTICLPNSRRDEVIERIRANCAEKKQVYWICTLVEESEHLNLQAAEELHDDLSRCLPELSIGLVHGRMKGDVKDQQLAGFKDKTYDVLVATTVVEVGVDVPNASLMIIENPERLGLSQLHQLRGRVGRGDQLSYCVLMYQTPLSHYAKERLAILRHSDDGFEIAQKDLELRGPGEVLGTRQAGLLQLRVADLARDQALLPMVSQLAIDIAAKSPQSIAPIIQRWVRDKEQFAVV